VCQIAAVGELLGALVDAEHGARSNRGGEADGDVSRPQPTSSSDIRREMGQEELGVGLARRSAMNATDVAVRPGV